MFGIGSLLQFLMAGSFLFSYFLSKTLFFLEFFPLLFISEFQSLENSLLLTLC